MLALGPLLLGPSLAGAQDSPSSDPRVVIALLPHGTTVGQLASGADAIGILSAGLGSVPIDQTFLDISQGNRVSETLYDGELPPLEVRGGRVGPPLWARAVERADSAPAEIVPGLLGSTLAEAGVAVRTAPGTGGAALIGVDREGVVDTAGADVCEPGCPAGLTILRTTIPGLHELRSRLSPGGLLIAVVDGTRAEQKLLPIGLVNEGLSGDLTSDSTRTDGLVITNDVAPTVLDWLGVDPPEEMNGSRIRAEGDFDPTGVADLQSELDHRPSRDIVVLVPLAVWLLLTALAALVWRRPGARVALRLLALSCAWAPGLLLVAASPELGELASALLVGIGAPLLALACARSLGPMGALALACGATVAGYAVDVVLGSPLTARSVLGPNPGAGVRFFGIGNELEAILTTLTLIGTGAYLETRPGLKRRAAAIWFVATAALAIAAFAPGRFGADVGAAIVLGVGAATAAVVALGLERRRAVGVVVGGGAAALAALFAVDLALGGAHLSRSVLDAQDASDVADVLDRRVRLMLHTFTHPVYPELLVACGALLLAGAVAHRRILAWFGGRWAARAGFVGATVGVLVGTLANDSGSVLLVIGTVCLAVTAGYFWATAEPA
jgi:hypothetical protein